MMSLVELAGARLGRGISGLEEKGLELMAMSSIRSHGSAQLSVANSSPEKGEDLSLKLYS